MAPVPDVAADAEALRELTDIASALGEPEIAQDLTALRDRRAAGQVYVACVGQFKRGKSTLINALLGESLLPTGVAPVTSAVTVIRGGETRAVQVHFHDRAPETIAIDAIASYATEAQNPGNVKRVSVIDLVEPNHVLANGLVLVDTPGVGSSSPLAAETTKAFVPRIDVALVVLGADPPVTGEELQLLDAIGAETREWLFVLNKADKMADADMAEAYVFTQRVLADRLGVVPDALFIVSALERLHAGAPTRDWGRLEEALHRLSGKRRDTVLRERACRRTRRGVAQLRHAIASLDEALTKTAADNDRRIASIDDWVVQATRELNDLDALLAADQTSAARIVRDGATARLRPARERAMAALDEALASLAAQRRLSWRHAWPLAQQFARRELQETLPVIEHDASEVYARLANRFVEMANALLRDLATVERPLAALPPLTAPTTLEGRRRFYFTEMMTLTATSPWRAAMEAVLPSRSRRDAIRARAERYLERLLDTNTSRVIGDLDERLTESRQELAKEIRSRIDTLVMSTRRATAHARTLRDEGQAAIERERNRLQTLRAHLDRIATDTDESGERREQI
jgi:GTP-binding protein EngB required for normal cell division